MIPLFGTAKELKKSVMGIVTGSESLEEPKEPEGTTVRLADQLLVIPARTMARVVSARIWIAAGSSPARAIETYGKNDKIVAVYLPTAGVNPLWGHRKYDAIFAAARYLKAAGAEEDLRRAIFAYNHANWYVDSVLMRARLIGGLPADLVGSLTQGC